MLSCLKNVVGEFGAHKGKGQTTLARFKDCMQILLKLSYIAISAVKFLSAILQCEAWAKSLHMVTPLCGSDHNSFSSHEYSHFHHSVQLDCSKSYESKEKSYFSL